MDGRIKSNWGKEAFWRINKIKNCVEQLKFQQRNDSFNFITVPFYES